MNHLWDKNILLSMVPNPNKKIEVITPDKDFIDPINAIKSLNEFIKEEIFNEKCDT